MRRVARAERMATEERPAWWPTLWTVPSNDPIVDSLRDAICAGRLPAGTKLGEEELSRVFGVSRTLVRQALHRLSFASIVTLRQNRGASVSSPTLEEAKAAYAARRLIESEIVAEATRHFTANDARRLREHCALQAEAEAGDDRSLFIRLLGEFHLLIAEIGGNPVLADFLAQLIPRTSLMQSLYEAREVASCAVEDHEALIRLMAKGDPDKAAKAMQKHLGTNLRRLRVSEEPAPAIDLAAVLRVPAPDGA